jgi:Tfp pilus assembly protein PilW
MSLVVGLGIGSLLMAAVASVWVYSARSFVDLGNYMEMDGGARYALDLMSADIRQADGVSSYSSNALTLKVGSNQLAYTFDAAQRTLFRRESSVTRKLLTDCDNVHYDLYQRNPTNGLYDYFPDASGATNAKLVEVTVLCTRSVLGRAGADSTALQSARIVIRKQK